MHRCSLTSSLRPSWQAGNLSLKHTYSYSQYDPKSQSLFEEGKSPKIISLVGKITSNINQILSTMKCCSNCQRQFKDVLQIFAAKVEKLRTDRDKLRQKYIEDIYQLQYKVQQLQAKNSQLLQTLQKITEQNSTNPQTRLQKQMKKNSSNSKSITFNFDEDQNKQPSLQQLYHVYSLELQKTPPSENSPKEQIKYDNILGMAVKYNLSNDQLEDIIRQYLSVEGQVINNEKQIIKLKKLQQELQKQRKKKQIRNDLQSFLKLSSRKNQVYK